MARYVWWSTAARRVIESLRPEHRREFDGIIEAIAVSPEPVPGLSTIKAIEFFGQRKFRYFDNDFPYMIFYRIDEEGDINIELVLAAFVT